MLSMAAVAMTEERLAAMVGPVALRFPRGNQAMQRFAGEVVGAVAEDDLLTVAEGEGESLTLLDGWGRETGICYRDLPLGQEFGPFLEAILAVSRGGSVLSPLGRSQAQGLPDSSQLWVFVTPS